MWIPKSYGDVQVELLNMDETSIEARIIEDMDSGVAVFYDRRWDVTHVLAEWLVEHMEEFQGKKVMVLGAGVGAETLVLAKGASHLWINDLSSVALDLCGEQLEHNGLMNYTKVLGRYEEVEMPKVDLIVASFLVYDRMTLESIRKFFTGRQSRFILMNEHLKEFKAFVGESEVKILFEVDGAACIQM